MLHTKYTIYLIDIYFHKLNVIIFFNLIMRNENVKNKSKNVFRYVVVVLVVILLELNLYA